MRPIMGKAEAKVISGDGYLDFGFVPDYVKIFQKPDSSGSLSTSSEAYIEGVPDSISGSGNGYMFAAITHSTSGSILTSPLVLKTQGVQAWDQSRWSSRVNSTSNDTAFAGLKMVGSSLSASIASTNGFVAFGYRND